jgi:hypothetical protein
MIIAILIIVVIALLGTAAYFIDFNQGWMDDDDFFYQDEDKCD